MEQKQMDPVEQLLQVNQKSAIPQSQSEMPIPIKNKLPLPQKKILLVLAGFLVIAGIGLFIGYKLNSPFVKQKPSVTLPNSESVPQLQEGNFDRSEADLAYLQEGKIWLVSKDLKKKMVYQSAGSGDQIVDFKFSPTGQLYWITDAGELWRTNDSSMAELLISKKQDMSNATQVSNNPTEPLSYVKGKVTNFHLSPDGNYVEYETLEKYTGCCGSSSDIPVTQLRIMKSDGTGKAVVVKPSSVNREVVFFDGWLPESKNILFHYSAPDEPTQGSPFFEVGLNGNNPKQYTAIEYPEAGGTITVAGAAPVFSLDNRKLAYVEDGVNGEGKIWTANMDGTQKRLLLDDKSLNLANLKWSEDGSFLLINSFNKAVAVDSDGKIIFRKEVKQPEEFEDTISQDNKYIAGLNKTLDGKTSKLFILNLDTGDKKEFSIANTNDQPSALYVYPQFFSDNGKLYYLVGPNQRSYSNKDSNTSSFQLWIVDTATWKNYEIADNVQQVRLNLSLVSSWKTYANHNYKYVHLTSPRGSSVYSEYDWIIKYPQDWTTSQGNSPENIFLPPGVSEYYWASQSISVSIEPINQPTPGNTTYKILRSIPTREGAVNVLEVHTIGGKEFNAEITNYQAIITKGNYKIIFNFGYALDQKYFSVFDSMIQSFNLTENTPDISSDWRNFRDSNFNFTFEYPQNVNVDVQSSPKKIVLSDKISDDFIVVTTTDSLSSYCDNRYKNGDKENCELFSGVNTPINIDWVNFTSPISAGPPLAKIEDQASNKVIVFSLGGDSQEIKGIFRQILSTFKFVN